MMKTLRKISAISLVGTLASGVLAGALTFDAWKSNLPKEAGDYKIVVGSEAKTADVIGAVEIAHALQYVYKEPVTSENAEVVFEKSETAISGGVSLTSDDSPLTYDEHLDQGAKDTVTGDDLDIFKTQTIVTDDGKEYKLTQVFWLKDFDQGTPTQTDAIVGFDKESEEKAPYPRVELPTDVSASTFAYILKLAPETGSVDWTKLKNKEVTLFGKKFVVGPETTEGGGSSDGKLVLYTASKIVDLGVGDTKTVEINGKTFTIKAISGSTENEKINLEINGEVYEFGDGTTKYVEGVLFYAENVYVADVPEKSVRVRLFVGGDKYEIKEGNHDLYINGEKVDGVYVDVGAESGHSSEPFKYNTYIKFYVSAPSDEKKIIKAGGEFVDPVFGTFKLSFEGLKPELKADDRDEVKIYMSSAKEVRIKVETKDGVVDVPILKWNDEDGDNNVDADEVVPMLLKVDSSGTGYIDYNNTATNEDLEANDMYFLVNGRVFWVKVDSSNKVDVKDVITGKTWYDLDVTSGSVQVTVGGRTYTIPIDTSAHAVKVATLDNADGSSAAYSLETASGKTVKVYLKDDDSDANEVQIGAVIKIDADEDGTDDNIVIGDFSGSYIKVDDTNDRFDIPSPTFKSGEGVMKPVTDEDKQLGFGKYAYIEYTYGDSDKADIYLSDKPVQYEVYVATEEAKKVTETVTKKVGEKIDGYKIKNIAVSGEELSVPKPLPFVGVLDTEVTDAMTKLISVGGPAVNKVTAEFLGVPYPTYGATLKEQGILNENEALIKIVEKDGKIAVLVFGWSADDTRAAAKALVNYIVSGAEEDKFKDKEAVKVVKTETSAEGYEVLAE